MANKSSRTNRYMPLNLTPTSIHSRQWAHIERKEVKTILRNSAIVSLLNRFVLDFV
jgi:hypothetical protein